MLNYDNLLDIAEKENISVIENFDMSDTRIKGLYCDNAVALCNGMTSSEKKCVFAEELGHYYTSTGDIIDQSSSANRKQELRARAWAYNKLIGLTGIVDCCKSKCQCITDMAEHLNVSEEFLHEALRYYRNKYGVCTKLDNYVIYFEPSVGVFELI